MSRNVDVDIVDLPRLLITSICPDCSTTKSWLCHRAARSCTSESEGAYQCRLDAGGCGRGDQYPQYPYQEREAERAAQHSPEPYLLGVTCSPYPVPTR